jgi:hypothetical protein
MRALQETRRIPGPRLIRRLLARLLALPLIVGTLAAGCTEPSAPRTAVPGHPGFIKEVDGRVQIFNAQLRSVEDPNIIDDPNLVDDPNLLPYGNFQIRVTPLADGSVLVAWKGTIFNPGGLTFTSWSLNDLDNGRPGLFVALGEVDGISDTRIDPEDATIISAELAAALFGTPDTIDDPNIRIVFHTVEQPLGALAGTF